MSGWEDRPVRILMVAPEPIFEPRGTPFSVLGRLKAYSDLGYSLVLLTYPFGKTVEISRVQVQRISRLPWISKVPIGPSFVKIPLDVLLFFKTLFGLIRYRPHLMHTHEEAGVWGTFLARLWNIPHVYDMHSSLPQQLSNFQFTRLRLFIRFFECLEHWVVKYSNAVITICLDLDQHVQRLVSGKYSVLIENVVDYATIFGKKDAREKPKAFSNKKIVLYTGTFEPYQGLDLLIESAPLVLRKIPSAYFVLVGGHSDQVAFYQDMVKKRNLAPFFLFTGQISPPEVDAWISFADVLVSPRKSGTNTPLKIYTYLRSGVPIVATRLWTHTQVLNDDVAVLTEPFPLSFAEGIIQVFSKPNLKKKLVRNAKALAEEKYSYREYCEKLRTLVETLVQPKH